MNKIIAGVTLAAAAAATTEWQVYDHFLHYNGEPVVLHGFGVDCTEYMLRTIGTKCFATVNWNDPANVITEMNQTQVDAIIAYLKQVTAPGVKPALRIPLTASYWLGVSTANSAKNFSRYTDLGGQYRTLITEMVNAFTDEGIVVILDLHNNDDTDNQHLIMSLKDPNIGGIPFW